MTAEQVEAVGSIGDVLIGEHADGRIAMALGDIEISGRPDLATAIDDFSLLLERRKRALIEIGRPSRILKP